MADTPQPQPKFDIHEFRVHGNHVLPNSSIESAVYPFLGDSKDMDTVKSAADALEKAYKDAGFGTVFVDIPEQQVDDGVVRLVVTEGKLDRIRIRGTRFFSNRQILAALPAVKPGETPRLPEVQEQITALNSRSSDRSITPILKAGRTPGTVDMDLAVQDSSPLHVAASVDNRRTADTTPTRTTLSVSYSNLWQRQDTVSLLYQTAPAQTRNAQVFSASYLGHWSEGLYSLSYLHTNSDVAALGTLGVLGKGSIYGAHWLWPIVNTPAATHSINIGVDYKDVVTQVFPSKTTTVGDSVSAPVTYFNWSAIYSGEWRGETRSLGTSIGLGFGLRGLGNSQAEFENARARGEPGYLYLRLNGQATQALPWGFGVLLRWNGQWTESPLVNNEQFSIGGADSVRGYLEAETLGDSGLSGGLELHSPGLPERWGKYLHRLYALAFVDGGVATLVDPLNSQDYNTRLWSLGAGLRLENASGLSGAIDYAVPRVDGVRTLRGDGRVHFSVKYDF
jgi:hemolysin activation/secretion protein